MADPKKQQQQPAAGEDPRQAELRALAARIFANSTATPGKTPEGIASKSLELARAFFRVWDEQQTQQPQAGLSTPTPQG